MTTPVPVVYILGCAGWKHEGENYYKIGRTIYPSYRMKQLKKQFNRNNLKFIMIFQTDVDGSECAVESYLHRRFRKQNLKDDDSTELYKVDINMIKKELKQLQQKGNGKILPRYQYDKW